ncbi:TPA: hypothetical protein ACL1V9_000355 [Streptococcus pneumoniae]
MDDSKNEYDFEREMHILRNFFCIESEKINFSDEYVLTEFIVKNINKYGSVFVPINLKEIYYSAYYKEQDWPHLFLINGYDKEKELFYVIDATQIYSDILTEQNFCITFEILERAYKSYFHQTILNKEKEYIFVVTTVVNELTETEIFHETFKYLFNQSSISSRELEIVYKILTNRDFTLFINRCIKNILKNDTKLVNYDFFVLEEKKIFDFFSKQASRYKERLFEIISSNSNRYNEVFECIQNSGKIITITEDNSRKFRFSFIGDKIYNSWFNDDSPKVRINQDLNYLIVKINVIHKEKDSKFVAGLYCFIDDNLYYFGLDSNYFINLDLMGKTPEIFRKRLETSEVYLKISRQEDSCKFSYSVDGITYFYATSLDIRSCHFSCGIGCKTYSKPTPLCIDFEDLLIG